MKKKFVLFNLDINKYWTGIYTDTPYSSDIKKAKLFDDEESLINEISTTGIKFSQVQVVYCNDL